jgi:hypothetical protein
MPTNGCQTEGCDITWAQENYDRERAFNLACQNGSGSNCPNYAEIGAFVGAGLIGSAALPSVVGAVGPAVSTVSNAIYGGSLQFAAMCTASIICGGLLFGMGSSEAEHAVGGGTADQGVGELEARAKALQQLRPTAIDVQRTTTGIVRAMDAAGNIVDLVAHSSGRLSVAQLAALQGYEVAVPYNRIADMDAEQ